MSNIWITSDTHFGHKNIIKHAGRPFDSVDEMNSELIRRWNDVVGHNDIVYHLGDFAWNCGAHETFLPALNGRIIPLLGNHDSPHWAASPYMEDTIDGHRVIFCHYPIDNWNGMYKGSIHVHGHTHQKRVDTSIHLGSRTFLRLNACVEATQFSPMSLNQLLRAAGTASTRGYGIT